VLVAALERSDNVADRDHAFAVLKRGYLAGRLQCQKARCALPDIRCLSVASESATICEICG
jgi:hypothetical protein